MQRDNCWEVMGCGREPGGVNAARGVCPAALPGAHAGANGGAVRGRCCWAVADVVCPSLADIVGKGPRLKVCLDCPFFAQVADEEARDFDLSLGRDETRGGRERA